jgi:hypothetical protein
VTSQSSRWRHPRAELTKLLARILLQPDMLTSSAFLQTSIPNTPPITVLPFRFIPFSKSKVGINSEFSLINANLLVSTGCQFILRMAAENLHERAKGPAG